MQLCGVGHRNDFHGRDRELVPHLLSTSFSFVLTLRVPAHTAAALISDLHLSFASLLFWLMPAAISLSLSLPSSLHPSLFPPLSLSFHVKLLSLPSPIPSSVCRPVAVE
jgi:hypothetical protein